jgi:hypothetical protein
MNAAQAVLIGFVFVVTLLALSIVGLYFVSPVGFGVAVGVIATAMLGTFFMLAVAVSNRIINGRGVRQPELRPEPPAQWQLQPPPATTISTNYHPVLGDMRPALPASAMQNLSLVDRRQIEEWD